MHRQNGPAGSGPGVGLPASASGLAECLRQAADARLHGDPFKAEALYRRVLEVQPDHAGALDGLGVLQSGRGLLSQAEQLFRRAIVVAPAFASAHTHLGDVLAAQRRHADAIAAYRHAASLGAGESEPCANLGALLEHLGRLDEALAAYREAGVRRPADAVIHWRLGALLAKLGQVDAAIAALRVACLGDRCNDESIALLSTLLQRQGHGDEARSVLGNAVFERGGTERALALLQHWQRLLPDDPAPRHRLAALSGADAPERAADGYVTDLFDRYAESFDRHLLDQLGYRAPGAIGGRLAGALRAPAADLDVLDAGCGTGLCAPVLRPYARRLVGVDLSPRMVDKARERGEYDALAVAELTAFLDAHPAAYDLIVSADTLVYFGALGAAGRAIARALRPGGWLAFSAEQAGADAAPRGFRLEASGRYSHTPDYLARVLAGTGMAVRSVEEATLRRELDRPVAGLIVLARKPVAAAERG